MADTPIAAPANKLLSVINKAIDFLVKGLGAPATINALTIEEPWLAYPVIRQIFTFGVNTLAASLDKSLEQSVDVVVIRFQNGSKRNDYDKVMQQFKEAPNAQALADAKAAFDNLVNRSH